jgi:hypothetical protein
MRELVCDTVEVGSVSTREGVFVREMMPWSLLVFRNVEVPP